MRKYKTQKKNKYILIALLAILFLVGCAKEKEKEPELTFTETEDEKEATYVILEHNTSEETFLLYSPEKKKEVMISYSYGTVFYDKYEKHTTAAKFTEGRVISVGATNKDGYVESIKLSNQVWEYEKITRFSIDEDRGILKIADKNYSIKKGVKVFSNGKEINLSDVSAQDIIKVVGVDKDILSVVVTTGNGLLSLTNTKLFEGSFLQLNNNIYLEITEDMNVELHEGTYTLTVANDGWGGSTQIEIVRGETTEVDLDTLKGEGYKKGYITFDINTDKVKVYVDGTLVDISQPVELIYGTHSLKIEADGYEAWQKYLYVHSETATIAIELTEEEDSTEEDSEEEDSEEEESTEEENSTEEDSTEGDTEESTEKEESTEETTSSQIEESTEEEVSE